MAYRDTQQALRALTAVGATRGAPGTHAGGEPLNLYRLGMLFVVRCRYRSCRAGNAADELELTPDRMDRFHAMNVFGDGDAADRLARLKQQIGGLTGQDLAQQPDVAAKLSRACQTLKNQILDPANVSALTGRLKRRVVLD